MITELAKEEIRRELAKEGFGNIPYETIKVKSNYVADTLQLIILFIGEYREGRSIFYKREIPGVVKRLVEKYSNDNYQVKEMAV